MRPARGGAARAVLTRSISQPLRAVERRRLETLPWRPWRAVTRRSGSGHSRYVGQPCAEPPQPAVGDLVWVLGLGGEALEKPWPAIVRDVDTDGNSVAWPPAQVDGVRSYECDYLDSLTEAFGPPCGIWLSLASAGKGVPRQIDVPNCNDRFDQSSGKSLHPGPGQRGARR